MDAPRPNAEGNTVGPGLRQNSQCCEVTPRVSGRKLRLPIYCWLILSAALASSSIGNARRVNPLDTSLNDAAYIFRSSEHVTESTSATQPWFYPTCEDSAPPEALLTPSPVLPFGHEKILGPVSMGRVNVRVSFLVGPDGQVQSAFVLDGAGTDDDFAVLRVVRGWRYRPARCNGVPTSSEIRVTFSIP